MQIWPTELQNRTECNSLPEFGLAYAGGRPCMVTCVAALSTAKSHLASGSSRNIFLAVAHTETLPCMKIMPLLPAHDGVKQPL